MPIRTLLMALLCASLASPVAAQEMDRQVVEVSLGGSSVLSLGGARGKVTLTDPSIADVQSAGGDLLVIGRKVGETNLLMFGSGMRSSWLIKVTLPARAIQSELARLFPTDDITARAVGGSLVLNGEVNSTPVVTQAEEVALGYLRSPSISSLGVLPNVINLLRVRSRQQVQLEVIFAEVNRRSIREIGVNLAGQVESGRVSVATGLQDVAASRGQAGSVVADQVFKPAVDNMGAIFFGIADGAFPFAATLSLLSRRNLSRSLAEPTLVAMSGQSAEFLAGGEFPYSRSTGLGGTTVEFKPFGVELRFTPTVLADRTIQLQTTMAVSAPDPTLTIIADGVPTQGFKRRSSSTTVRLRDGQSFAIAGMLSDEMENIIHKVPGLGDIPVLGLLFSSKSFDRRETELVVVVSAHLVDPIDSDRMPPLPGENKTSDPTDWELFLLGLDEVKGKASSPRSTGAAARDRRAASGRLGFWR